MATSQNVQLFATLDQLTPDDLRRTGGKAYNCARLKQAGFPVPDGIVIPADATDDDLLLLTGHPWLDQQPAGTRYAVRSSGLGEDSAGHSFAGIHETKLNVDRPRLIDAVVACRMSGASSHARAYRDARQVGEEAQIGVLVQRMVLAVTSGVAFTINPITGGDEIVVNAARGLGEALVSGLIDPDEFHISKRDGAVRVVAPGVDHAGDDRHVDVVDDATRIARRAADADRTPLRLAAGHRVVPRRPRFLDRAIAPGDDAAVAERRAPREPRTPNPEPCTQNREPRTPHPEPRTPNPEPRTTNPEPRTPNPEP